MSSAASHARQSGPKMTRALSFTTLLLLALLTASDGAAATKLPAIARPGARDTIGRIAARVSPLGYAAQALVASANNLAHAIQAGQAADAMLAALRACAGQARQLGIWLAQRGRANDARIMIGSAANTATQLKGWKARP